MSDQITNEERETWRRERWLDSDERVRRLLDALDAAEKRAEEAARKRDAARDCASVEPCRACVACARAETINEVHRVSARAVEDTAAMYEMIARLRADLIRLQPLVDAARALARAKGVDGLERYRLNLLIRAAHALFAEEVRRG